MYAFMMIRDISAALGCECHTACILGFYINGSLILLHNSKKSLAISGLTLCLAFSFSVDCNLLSQQ